MEGSEIVNIILMVSSGMLSLVVILLIVMKRSQAKVNAEKLQRQAMAIEHKKSLLFHSLEEQEKERNRLSAELHDGIVSKLNILNLRLTSMENELISGSLTSFQSAKDILNTTIEDARRISYDLMPVVLESFGLITALKEMKEVGSTSTTTIHFSTPLKDADIKKETSIHLYRISQELVNNALKYANGANIEIELLQNDKHLSLNIADDGSGTVDQLNEKIGLGLRNIQSRLLFLNGEMNISDRHPGLLFAITIPNSSLQ